jgi:hypothetical protein
MAYRRGSLKMVVAGDEIQEDKMTTGAMVNQLLPAATLPALDGTAVDFATYRGKKLLIFMWASW